MNELLPNDQDNGGMEQPSNPRQFRVIDIVALVSLAALVAAMAAPIVRWMSTGDQIKFLLVMLAQLVITTIAFVGAVYMRTRLLKRAGRRIYIGYCGAFEWRHWPAVKSCIAMGVVAAIQLAIAAALTQDMLRFGFAATMAQLQIALVAGFALARFIWRVYPSAMEFFENGVALTGVVFLDWEQVDLRSSQTFPDRIVVVVRPIPKSKGGETKIVQVSDAVQEELFRNKESVSDTT